MPKLNKTTVFTAVGVALGGVLYARFGRTHVQSALSKVA